MNLNVPFALLLAALVTGSESNSIRAATIQESTRSIGSAQRVYEVRDLLLRFDGDWKGDDLGVQRDWVASGQKAAPATAIAPVEPTTAEREARCEVGGRAILDIVRKQMVPQFKGSENDLRCTASGSLIAVLDAEQHAWLSAFLEGWRNFDGSIEIEVRVIEGPADGLNQLGLVPHAILPDGAALRALDESVKRTRGFDLITTPRLVVLPGQRANLSVTSEVRYVGDWNTVVVEPGEREIDVPLIRVVSEGLSLDVRALPTTKDVFQVDLRIQNCKVRRPIRTATVAIGQTGRQVEVALVESENVKQQLSLLLASGASAVVAGPTASPVSTGPSPAIAKAMILVVTARRVPREKR